MRSRYAFPLLLFIAAAAGTGGWIFSRTHQEAQVRHAVEEQGRSVTAALSFELSLATLQRMESLARNPTLAASLRNASPDTIASASVQMEGAAVAFDADLVFLMNTAGTVVACGRGLESLSLIGKNYAFRTYFKEALVGHTVSYPALGVTTGKLGLYLSAPVRDEKDGQVYGVLVVKMGMQHLGQYLSAYRLPAALLSEDGVVLTSNRAGLAGQAVSSLPPETIERMREAKQFGPDGPRTLGWLIEDGRLGFGNAQAVATTLPVAGTPFRLLVWDDRTLAGWPPALAAALCLLAVLFAGRVARMFWEQRAADRELRLLGMVMQHSANGIVVTDTQGRIEYVNPAFTRMTGYEPAEAIGKNPRILKSGEQPSAVYEELWRTVLAGEEWRGEFHNRRKDGTLYWEHASIAPVRDSGGAVTHLLAVKEDITARKDAEATLRERNHFLQSLLDGISTPVFYKDAELRYLGCNAAFERVFGKTRDEVVGHGVHDLYPTDLADVYDAADRRLLASPGTQVYDAQVRNAAGESATVVFHKATFRDNSGRVAGIVGVVLDVTDKARAAEELRESRDFYLRLLDEFPIPVWRTGRDSRCDYANRGMCELLGRTKEAILRNDWLDAIHPDDAVRFATTREKAMRELRPLAVDVRLRVANGEYDYAVTQAIPFEGTDGLHAGYLGVCLDVNETRKAQEELMRKNLYVEMLQSVSAQANDAPNVAAALRTALDLICEFTGWPLGRACWQAQGKQLLEHLWHTPRQGAYRTFRERAESNPAPWQCPAHGEKLAAGEPVWIEALDEDTCGIDTAAREAHLQSSFLLPVPSGKEMKIALQFFSPGMQAIDRGFLQVMRMLALQLARAIQRKLDQEALQESEERFKTISHAAQDAIVMIDAEGRIVFWNPAAERIFGHSERDVVGRCVHDLLVPERLREQAHAGFRGFTAGGHGPAIGKLLELVAIRKDGQELPIEIAVSAIRRAERWQAIAIIRDITARKQMEGQLAQAQKLESIGSMAAGIAHEINTPTQYVSDNTSFLTDAFGDLGKLIEAHQRLCEAVRSAKTDTLSRQREAEDVARKVDLDYLMEEIPKALRQSKEGLTRISEIVLAMKEFSHPSSKEKKPVDLNQAIQTTVTVARNEWKYVAEMTLDLEAGLPPVPGMPGEINQTLLNLIVNAAQAIGEVVKDKQGEKGRITISTHRLDDSVDVRIADTGGGIPEKIRSRIFDPFFTTKDVGKGTGQGLAIARTVVVKHHGGTLDFETVEGQGTSFVIRFPLEDPARQEHVA